MKNNFLFCFLLLYFGLKAQDLATIFIDTLVINVEGKTIHKSNKTTLKFISNNKDNKVIIYNNGTYELMARIALSKYNIPTFGGDSFFKNGALIPLNSTNYMDFEDCSEILISKQTFENIFNDSVKTESISIKLCYRLFKLAPKDTLNYKYNYREGPWTGREKGTEEIIVNYKNDKKHGLASAIYSNGVSYNVNFTDGVVSNFGKGVFDSSSKKGKTKHSYILPNIVTQACDSANSNNYLSFNLVSSKKTKEVVRLDDLSVHFQKKGINHDSIEYRVRGDFMSITNDTMNLYSDEIDVHDFYKKNTDSLHYHSQAINPGFVKIPVKEISKIYYGREQWKTFTLGTTLISFATALIVAPLISLQKKGFNHERFNSVALPALGVMSLSITFGIAFSQKEYLLRSDKKEKKIWLLMPGELSN